MTKHEILNMKLHQRAYPDSFTEIIRVPSGWIYNQIHSEGAKSVTSTFVPFETQFRVKELNQEIKE